VRGENLLETLRKENDNVSLKHDILQGKTIAVLVSGTNVHIGIANIFKGDQLNRRKGRLIALGRASHAKKVYNGQRQLRQREQKRKEPLAFTIEGVGDVEKLVDDLFSGEFWK